MQLTQTQHIVLVIGQHYGMILPKFKLKCFSFFIFIILWFTKTKMAFMHKKKH